MSDPIALWYVRPTLTVEKSSIIKNKVPGVDHQSCTVRIFGRSCSYTVWSDITSVFLSSYLSLHADTGCRP